MADLNPCGRDQSVVKLEYDLPTPFPAQLLTKKDYEVLKKTGLKY